MDAFADESAGIEGFDLEYEALAVDFDELGFAADLHADGGGGNVLYVDQRADGALRIREVGLNAFAGGIFHQGDHVGRAEYGEVAAAEVLCGLFFCDGDGLHSGDSDFHAVPPLGMQRSIFQLAQDVFLHLVKPALLPCALFCLFGVGDDDIEVHVRAFEIAVGLRAEEVAVPDFLRCVGEAFGFKVSSSAALGI